jgi:hypothetical protein
MACVSYGFSGVGMVSHEYSIADHNRAVVGRWLFWGALVLAGTAAWAIIELADIGRLMGFDEAWADKLLPLVTAGTLFPAGHYAANHWAWKARWVRQLFGIPNLNGMWDCRGVTLNQDGSTQYEWGAAIEISQTWEKIFVRLKTAQSDSSSITAALIKLPSGSFKLIYTYRNAPRLGEPELHQHAGCCELEFNAAKDRAEGEYFNNRGRTTFGRMTLTRKV